MNWILTFDAPNFLRGEMEQAEKLGEAFGMNTQLLRVLQDANVNDEYDVLIVDPPATEVRQLYNAVAGNRLLIIPVEPSAKGQQSVKGLENLVQGLEEELDIEVGVLAAVPIGFKNTSDQQDILAELEYGTPVVIGDRTSMMEGCWKQQYTAFDYVRIHRNRLREYEIETLEHFDELARYLEHKVGMDAPNPPEPGDLDHAAPEVNV